MVLVLKNDQMKDLLPMGEEIDAIEQAFRELGQGVAMNAPRAIAYFRSRPGVSWPGGPRRSGPTAT